MPGGGMFARRKGANGELEIMRLIQPTVDRVCEGCGCPQIVLQKNRDQRYAKKQYDVIGLPWFAFEVKRVENQSGINGWWEQVKDAAREGQIPVLFYRQNNRPWMVRTKMRLDAG